MAQDFKRPQRDAPQDDAALTLRRRHGAACCFLHVSRYESVCSYLGPRVKMRRAKAAEEVAARVLARSCTTKRSGYCRSLRKTEMSLGLLFLFGGVFQLPDLLGSLMNPLLLGLLKPVQGCFRVGMAVNAFRIQEAQVVLSLGHSLFGGPQIPPSSLSIGSFTPSPQPRRCGNVVQITCLCCTGSARTRLNKAILRSVAKQCGLSTSRSPCPEGKS